MTFWRIKVSIKETGIKNNTNIFTYSAEIEKDKTEWANRDIVTMCWI